MLRTIYIGEFILEHACLWQINIPQFIFVKKQIAENTYKDV